MNDDALSEDAATDWRTTDQRADDIAQANALREQASADGLRFEVFLPSDLAVWVLDLVARGVFTDPGEAAFVMLQEQQDLEPHDDLRQEILHRSLLKSMNDPHPGYSQEEVWEHLRGKLAEPRREPALWRKRVAS